MHLRPSHEMPELWQRLLQYLGSIGGIGAILSFISLPLCQKGKKNLAEEACAH